MRLAAQLDKQWLVLLRSKINLSSVAGIKVFAPGGTVYSGTKFAVSAISEGLRHEVGEKVRVTSIEPGAVESDLKFTTSGTAAETVLDFYKQAIPTASVARAIAFAVEQPDDVDINAIVIRPTVLPASTRPCRCCISRSASEG